MFRRLHQIHAHIFQRKVEDGQASKFMQQHDTLAVGNGDVSEDHTHTPATVFPAKSLAEGRRGSWTYKHIFKHGFHLIPSCVASMVLKLLINDGKMKATDDPHNLFFDPLQV